MDTRHQKEMTERTPKRQTGEATKLVSDRIPCFFCIWKISPTSQEILEIFFSSLSIAKLVPNIFITLNEYIFMESEEQGEVRERTIFSSVDVQNGLFQPYLLVQTYD